MSLFYYIHFLERSLKLGPFNKSIRISMIFKFPSSSIWMIIASTLCTPEPYFFAIGPSAYRMYNMVPINQITKHSQFFPKPLQSQPCCNRNFQILLATTFKYYIIAFNCQSHNTRLSLRHPGNQFSISVYRNTWSGRIKSQPLYVHLPICNPHIHMFTATVRLQISYHRIVCTNMQTNTY